MTDYISNKNDNGNMRIGKMVILSSSFTGSSRLMKEIFLDSTIIVQKYGKPDFFITWRVIQNGKKLLKI